MTGLQATAAAAKHGEFRTLYWVGGIDGCLRLVDQTRLPLELIEIECRTVESVWQAIRNLQVRARRQSELRRLMAFAWAGSQAFNHQHLISFRASIKLRRIWLAAVPRR